MNRLTRHIAFCDRCDERTHLNVVDSTAEAVDRLRAVGWQLLRVEERNEDDLDRNEQRYTVRCKACLEAQGQVSAPKDVRAPFNLLTRPRGDSVPEH